MSTLDLLISLGTALLVAITSYFNAKGRDHINKTNEWNAAIAEHISKQVTTTNGRGTLVQQIEQGSAHDEAVETATGLVVADQSNHPNGADLPHNETPAP